MFQKGSRFSVTDHKHYHEPSKNRLEEARRLSAAAQAKRKKSQSQHTVLKSKRQKRCSTEDEGRIDKDEIEKNILTKIIKKEVEEDLKNFEKEDNSPKTDIDKLKRSPRILQRMKAEKMDDWDKIPLPRPLPRKKKYNKTVGRYDGIIVCTHVNSKLRNYFYH